MVTSTIVRGIRTEKSHLNKGVKSYIMNLCEFVIADKLPYLLFVKWNL